MNWAIPRELGENVTSSTSFSNLEDMMIRYSYGRLDRLDSGHHLRTHRKNVKNLP